MAQPNPAEVQLERLSKALVASGYRQVAEPRVQACTGENCYRGVTASASAEVNRTTNERAVTIGVEVRVFDSAGRATAFIKSTTEAIHRSLIDPKPATRIVRLSGTTLVVLTASFANLEELSRIRRRVVRWRDR